MRMTLVAAGNIGMNLTHVGRYSQITAANVVDPDTVSRENVASGNFHFDDAGRPKAEVLAQAINRATPALPARAFVRGVEYLPLGLLRSAEIVMMSPDSQTPRKFVNRSSPNAFIIDGGVNGPAGLARVDVYQPVNGSCPECAWGPAQYRLVDRQKPCFGFHAPPAAPASLSSPGLGMLAASLMLRQLERLLDGDVTIVGTRVVIDTSTMRSHRSWVPRNPGCQFDHRVQKCQPLHLDPKTRLSELIDGQVFSAVGQRLVTEAWCLECKIPFPIHKVSRALALLPPACPACSSLRVTPVADGFADQLTAGSPPEWLVLNLGAAGFEDHDIVRLGEQDFELRFATGDLEVN